MTVTFDCTYLGRTENKLSDGNTYSTLNFYDFKHNEMLSLNVVHNAANAPLVGTFSAMLSNEPCILTVRFVPKDKLYRMQLVEISA